MTGGPFCGGYPRKDSPMRKIILAVTASILVLGATAACNTVSGAGDDLKSVSDDVDQAL